MMFITLRAFTQHSTHSTESRHNSSQSRKMSGKFSKLFNIRTFKENDYFNLVSIGVTKCTCEIATQRGKGSYKFKMPDYSISYQGREGGRHYNGLSQHSHVKSREKSMCLSSSIWLTSSTLSNPETNLAHSGLDLLMSMNKFKAIHHRGFPNKLPPLLHSGSLPSSSENVLS